MFFNEESPVGFLLHRSSYDFRGRGLASRCNGNLDVSTFFQLHFIAVFVSQRVFDAEISIPAGAPLNCNLCLFRLFPASRQNDFVDSSAHDRTCPLWNSACIQIPLHDSCGFGHPWPRHFFFDARACRVEKFFFGWLMPHTVILAAGEDLYSPILHSCEICALIYWVDSISQASAFSRP